MQLVLLARVTPAFKTATSGAHSYVPELEHLAKRSTRLLNKKQKTAREGLIPWGATKREAYSLDGILGTLGE